MSEPQRDVPDRASAALLFVALLACPLAAASAQQAAPAPVVPTDAGRVEMTTVGTYLYYRPQAHVRLERPSYVAVFEVEPGVGATLLYPADAWSQRLEPAGEHGVDLTGHRARTARRAMIRHLASAFAHRPPVVPRNHLVVVASDRPLRLDGLLSGRIFEHDHGRAGVGEVTRALLAHVTRWKRPAAWDWAATSYWKFHDPSVLAIGAGLPWLGGSLQFFRPFGGHTSLTIPWCFPADRLVFLLWASPACPLRQGAETRVADRPRDLADPPTDPRDDGPDRADPRLPEDLGELLDRLADATSRLDRDERGTLRTLELLHSPVDDRVRVLPDLRWRGSSPPARWPAGTGFGPGRAESDVRRPGSAARSPVPSGGAAPARAALPPSPAVSRPPAPPGKELDEGG